MVVAGLGMGVPVGVGVLVHQPALGALVAIGAMAGGASGSVLGLGLCAAAAGWLGVGLAWWALVLVAGVVVLVGGMSRDLAVMSVRFVTLMVITSGLATATATAPAVTAPIAAATSAAATSAADPSGVGILLGVGAVWGALLARLQRPSTATAPESAVSVVERERPPEVPSRAAWPWQLTARGLGRWREERARRKRLKRRQGAVLQRRGWGERLGVVWRRWGLAVRGRGRRWWGMGVRWWGRLQGWGGWEYAVRLVLCLGAAEVVGQVWEQPTSAWIAVTVVIVLGRRAEGSLRKPVERTLGTAAGVVAGSVVLVWVPPQWLFILVVAVLAAVRPALKERNYILYAAVMTPLALMLMEGGRAVKFATIGYRLADTLIGCALALVIGYLPWTRRPRAVVD